MTTEELIKHLQQENDNLKEVLEAILVRFSSSMPICIDEFFGEDIYNRLEDLGIR